MTEVEIDSSVKQKITSKKAIPDRWLDYRAIGTVIEDTNFVAFKVPLHDNICEGLPEIERHTTRDVIGALPGIGLVINLTNTQTDTRYYQPNDWHSNGIDYRWIKVQGHVVPSTALLVQFCRTVKSFVEKNPTKLIGIHCTHGLNRTGYFVCSYMVLVMNMDPKEAIERFNAARGYDIERANYLSSVISHAKDSRLKKLIETDWNEGLHERRSNKRTHTSTAKHDFDSKRYKKSAYDGHHGNKSGKGYSNRYSYRANNYSVDRSNPSSSHHSMSSQAAPAPDSYQKWSRPGSSHVGGEYNSRYSYRGNNSQFNHSNRHRSYYAPNPQATAPPNSDRKRSRPSLDRADGGYNSFDSQRSNYTAQSYGEWRSERNSSRNESQSSKSHYYSKSSRR